MSLRLFLHGIWAGWIAVLLVARSGAFVFVAEPPPLGIVSACFTAGYAKQADWFWYAAMLGGGAFGAALNWTLAAVYLRLGWVGFGGMGVPVAGWMCLILASFGALSTPGLLLSASGLLAGAGWLLPWLSRGWAESAPKTAFEVVAPRAKFLAWWCVGAVIVSFLLTYDTCLHLRPLDTLHEGGQLVYVQSWMAGDPPGLAGRTQYGPLYAHSLAWWMNAFGLTVSVERGYFIAVQFLGTFIHLLLLGLAVRSVPVLAVGAWLLLVLSPAPNIQFGWSNALRTAIPLLALWLCRGTPGRLAVSGAVAGLGWLYSAEYGMAGFASCLVVLAVTWRDGGSRTVIVWAGPSWKGGTSPALRVGAWMGGAVASVAVVLSLIYGSRVLEALGSLLGGGYILARLQGHSVSPLPAFPWWESVGFAVSSFRALLELAAIWVPGMLCLTAAGIIVLGRVSRGGEGNWFAWGLVSFTLLSQVPVIARPLWQISTSMPPAILLAAILGDTFLRGGRAHRVAVWAGLALSFLYGLAILQPMQLALSSKYMCLGSAPLPAPDPLKRLGTMHPGEKQAREMAGLVEAIQARCPPDGRVYLAAPRLAWACFLADRAPLGPFPLTYLAATRDERLRMVESMEKKRPPLALVTGMGIELPFAVEHPEEKEWLERNYRLAERVGEAELWVIIKP